MSHLYYSTRLYFTSRGGVAKLHGRQRELTEAPVLRSMRVGGIEYTPEVGVARIRPRDGEWRDMTSDEIHAADELLRQLVPTT